MLKFLNCDGAKVMTISTRSKKKSVSEGKNPTNEDGRGVKYGNHRCLSNVSKWKYFNDWLLVTSV
ncbi:MAG: hypothetical protein BGP01_13835 [Paludibacter sp. 47-17]|nr:MAG: hypothetical protein BGP01_13835 [Paludibacter sp. 47-17]